MYIALPAAQPCLLHIIRHIASVQIVAVYLVHHLLKGEASKWSPWMAVIPKTIESVANWETSELLELQDRIFQSAAEDRNEQLIASCASIVSTLRTAFPALFPPEFTPELLRWALQTVSARAYGRRIPHAALVPMADVFNHSNVPVKYELERPGKQARDAAEAASTASRVDARVAAHTFHEEDGMSALMPHSPLSSSDSEKETDSRSPDHVGSKGYDTTSDGRPYRVSTKHHGDSSTPQEAPVFRLWVSGPHGYTTGSEVFNSYGRRDNRHLVLEYGFVILDNHWEQVVCRPGGILDIAPHPKPTHSSKLISLLVKLGLSMPEFTVAWNTWCEDSLPYFRAHSLTPEEFVIVQHSDAL
jgi:hypothetical protein